MKKLMQKGKYLMQRNVSKKDKTLQKTEWKRERERLWCRESRGGKLSLIWVFARAKA